MQNVDKSNSATCDDVQLMLAVIDTFKKIHKISTTPNFDLPNTISTDYPEYYRRIVVHQQNSRHRLNHQNNRYVELSNRESNR